MATICEPHCVDEETEKSSNVLRVTQLEGSRAGTQPSCAWLQIHASSPSLAWVGALSRTCWIKR